MYDAVLKWGGPACDAGSGVISSMQLPEAFDADHYVETYPDLGHLDPLAARQHYVEHGQAEGRRANRLATRQDFINLIPRDATSLEIGPFYSPVLTGPNVSYFDVLSQTELRARARSLNIDDAHIPRIDFVSSTGDLAEVNRTFGSVVSSHCIEHQPDLIYHLEQVSRILAPKGRYYVLLPDKRYCFDVLIAETTIAEVIGAHQQRRRVHPLKSVIEHRAMTTHNDVARHWAGDHGVLPDDHVARIVKAMEEYRAAAGEYIDVHAWYFTPQNAPDILYTLSGLGMIDLVVERCYPTLNHTNEFWMVLGKH